MPVLEDFHNRLDTFGHWPQRLSKLTNDLANDGFYLEGKKRLRCFYCKTDKKFKPKDVKNNNVHKIYATINHAQTTDVFPNEDEYEDIEDEEEEKVGVVQFIKRKFAGKKTRKCRRVGGNFARGNSKRFSKRTRRRKAAQSAPILTGEHQREEFAEYEDHADDVLQPIIPVGQRETYPKQSMDSGFSTTPRETRANTYHISNSHVNIHAGGKEDSVSLA